jgi:hypothetical protein
MNGFDSYEFVLLPHGGQSHSTFNDSIPKGVKLDNTLERNIYYNHFDGFTARSNTGLEKTQEYFKRLEINEFVNLVTASDNYSPQNYPNAKAKEAAPFVKTWMMALPTFNGLRLSLSESSRLTVGRDSIRDVIYNYITSQEFTLHIQAIVNAYRQMKDDLDSEKRSMLRIWNKRDKQISTILENVTGMYGSIEGIVSSQKALPTIDALSLDTIVDNETDI